MKVSEFIQFEWLHPTIKESMIETHSLTWHPKKQTLVVGNFRDTDITNGLRPICKEAKWNLEEYIELMKIKSHNRFLADKLKVANEMRDAGIIDIEAFGEIFINIMEQSDFSLEEVWL